MSRLSPDEILEELNTYGVKLSRSGLNLYTQQNFIPQPTTGSLGRGQGRFSDYPADTTQQAYAAYKIIKSGVPSTHVYYVRKVSMAFLNDPSQFLKIFNNESYSELKDDTKLCAKMLSAGHLARSIALWVVWHARFTHRLIDQAETFVEVLIKEHDDKLTRNVSVNKFPDDGRYNDNGGSRGAVRYLTKSGTLYSLQSNGNFSVEDTSDSSLVIWDSLLEKFN